MADPRHLFVLPVDPQFNAKNASIDANNPVSEWANRVGTSLNIASDQFGGNGGQNQNGLDSVGRFVGDVAATLPLAEMKITQGAGEGASMLARALHGGINLGAQGAVGGAELSGGQNVGQNAGAGAALAAALGGAGSAVAPKVADAVSKLAGTKLGQALIDSAKKLGIQVDPSRTDAPYLQWLHDQSEYVSSAENYRKAVADMVNSGMAADDIRAYAKRVGFDPNGMSNLDDVVAYKKDNLNATVGAQFTRPLTPITPEQAKTAMGSRADDVGTFHANPGLTPDVQAEATQLAAQGIPLAHALAEARIKSIGAQDNPALVTRDPALQREFNEGAKLNTPEGQALNAQKTGNNAAAIKAMNDAVAKYGDAPAAGDAHEAAAKALASASDAKQSAVDAAYKAARSADPEARIEPNALYKVLNSDEARAVPTNTPEGALLANTRSAIDLAQNAGGTKLLPKGMIPDAFNNISKMANRKYGADGATNYWIGKVTKAAQDDLNQVDSIGGPWQEAKNLHAQYATEFQDPQAVRNIIARDRGGNFVNQDAWPKLDKNFVGPDATNFAQITDALKNNGATDVIDMMRAHVAHNAMIAGKGQNGGNAVDQMINSNLSGKAYLNYLDKVGQNRMNMLFSPDQQAKLANIGHATNFINEPVPNTVNTSNTDSANANRLAQALAMAKGRSATEITLPKLVAGAVGGAVGHFVPGGEVLGSAIGMGAKQALDAAKTARANKAVAETLMSLKTSQSSRDSAVNDNAKILAEALARQRGAQSGVLAPAILNNKKGSK
jgi:hypothetical protein